MARIAGVNLPTQKRLEVGLTYIFGIGRSRSREIAAALRLVHDVYFRWEFLDDHEDPIAFLKRWGLPRRMRDNGTTPVWVGTAGLS